MKKSILAIITAAALLCGCIGSRSTLDTDWQEISWRAFCDANGFSYDDNSSRTINLYLDTWCGSCDEDSVLEAAGIDIDNL